MRYRKLGNTGLIVSEMCLGAMTFGSGEGMWATVAGVSQENVTELIKTALDRGINFIDTADFYSNGRSEVVTGNALRMLGVPRDSYVLATKVLLRMGPGHNQIGLSRYHIMENINASLKRLQVDHIDLYQIHGRDPCTPLEETLDALDDCVRAGKVRYFGLCNLVGLGNHQVAVDLGQEKPRALREPADVLLDRRARHRTRDRRVGEGPESGHHAVEPTRGRPVVGKILA